MLLRLSEVKERGVHLADTVVATVAHEEGGAVDGEGEAIRGVQERTNSTAYALIREPIPVSGGSRSANPSRRNMTLP